jgi:hypothetical protein
MGDEPIFRINVLHQRIQKENCGRRNLSAKTTPHEMARKTEVRILSQKLMLGGSLRARRSRRRLNATFNS